MPEAMNENNDINVSKKSHPLLFSLIFFSIAIVLCVISVSEFLIYKQKNETFIEVIGKIVDYNSDKDDRLRAIIAEYEVDGQKYELNSKKYVDIPDSIGSVVSIKYNPDNPSEAIFTYEKTGFTFIAISFGVLFFGIFN